MTFFVCPYTIHFDDTMAYGSHHFLTSFKFQCAARETLLYGDLIFDKPGVPAAIESVHLFTAEAYARNLSPAKLGDRLAILLSLEEWGHVSARFCYRVINSDGIPICAGFQTHVCADPSSGSPVPLPLPLRDAFDSIRCITEGSGASSFRESLLAGGDKTNALFTSEIRELAVHYLAERHPAPRIVITSEKRSLAFDSTTDDTSTCDPIDQAREADQEPEAWLFPGQGCFDSRLLRSRLDWFCEAKTQGRNELERGLERAAAILDSDVLEIMSSDAQRIDAMANQYPWLTQVAIYLQSVIGAKIRREAQGKPSVVVGHSFGELAALTVAEAMNLGDGLVAVAHRVKAIELYGDAHGKMCVMSTSRANVAEELAISRLEDIAIAGRNSEDQTVLSGPKASLSQFRAKMRAKGVSSIDISTPTAFHHPSLRLAANYWYNHLQVIEFHQPQIPILSPLGRQLIHSSEHLATHLVSQLVRPFDLHGAITDLAAAGIKRLVDCGSSGSFARLLTMNNHDTMLVEKVTELITARTAHDHSARRMSKGDLALKKKLRL